MAQAADHHLNHPSFSSWYLHHVPQAHKTSIKPYKMQILMSIGCRTFLQILPESSSCSDQFLQLLRGCHRDEIPFSSSMICYYSNVSRAWRIFVKSFRLWHNHASQQTREAIISPRGTLCCQLPNQSLLHRIQ